MRPGRDRITLFLLGAIVLSIALRMGASVYLGESVEELPGTADQISYHALAQRVLDGQGFTFDRNWWPATRAGEPTAHWSYLYTFYLVAVYAVFGVHPLAARLIQSVIVGVMQVYLAYLIGARLFGRLAGLAGAILTAAYAYFIYYAATLMTEPFYFTAILASLYLAMRVVDQTKAPGQGKNGPGALAFAAGLGLALGAAVLLRQLYLLFIPFLGLWMLWAGSRRALWPTALSMAIVVALVLPFTAFNYLRFDQFVLLNTNAGFAFFWGNHPIYGTHFVGILPPSMGTYVGLIPPELRDLSEAALDQALLKRGVGFVLQDPVRYLLLSASRFPVYFKFWPSADSGTLSNFSRVASFGLLWPLMLYGLIRTIVENRSTRRAGAWMDTALLLLFGAVYTLIHLFSWALIRYRLPVDAVLVLFAGAGAIDLVLRFQARRRREPLPAVLAPDRP